MEQTRENTKWTAIAEALAALENPTTREVIDWTFSHHPKVASKDWLEAHQAGIRAILTERRWARWATLHRTDAR